MPLYKCIGKWPEVNMFDDLFWENFHCISIQSFELIVFDVTGSASKAMAFGKYGRAQKLFWQQRGLCAACFKKLFNSERNNKSLRRAPVIHFTTSEGHYLSFLFEVRLCFYNKPARKERHNRRRTSACLGHIFVRRNFACLWIQELNVVYDSRCL